MVPNTFRLEVYAYGERNQIIEKCRSSLASNGGDLLDFKMFSDMLMNLIIEIPVKNISKLESSLESLNWKTDLKLGEGILSNDSISLIQGTMSVTFASGTGERKDVIPAVPG
jgi:hypothetical protein